MSSNLRDTVAALVQSLLAEHLKIDPESNDDRTFVGTSEHFEIIGQGPASHAIADAVTPLIQVAAKASYETELPHIKRLRETTQKRLLSIIAEQDNTIEELKLAAQATEAAALEKAAKVAEDDTSETYLRLAAKANDETRRLCRFLGVIDAVEQKYVYRAILGSAVEAVRALIPATPAKRKG